MKAKIVYWLIIGPLFLGGLLVWLWTQGEASGTVVTTSQKVEEVPHEPEAYQYNGKYVTLQVPGIFRERTHSIPDSGPVKETIFFVKESGGNNEKIAVTVEERDPKTLDASPSYQSRKNNSLYTEQLNQEKSESILIKQSDPFELTHFFFVDEFLVSFSYTATAPREGEKEMLETVRKSLRKTASEQEEKSQKSLQ